MTAEPWLARAAARRPDRVALATPGERLTYAELHARSRAAAGELAARGVRPGDRVALLLPAGADFAVALHACLLLGAAAMPVDLRLGEAERAAQLAGAAAVVDAPLGAGVTAAAESGPSGGGPSGGGPSGGGPFGGGPSGGGPSEGGPSGAGPPRRVPAGGAQSVAVVVHTSGTTGAPRPVELTLANVEANALGSAVALGLDPSERWLCPLPLSHVGGLMVLLRSAIYATTAVLDPPDALHDVTLASLVPTQLHRILDAGPPPAPRLRAILLGGAGASQALLERARDAGLPVAPTYGLTQACSQVTVAEPGDTETAGFPLPGVHIQIAPDGEILVSGPTVAGGGLLRTGDLGRLDERGRLIVSGRRSDVIVSGGENVAPAEVEAVLERHPAVAEAGVFARPDPEWGEAVVAAVVARDGAPLDPDELRAFCRTHLAGFKVPKAIEPVRTLPRTASGKLRRGVLK
jgi:o-succinylbenzoate---CoA ligase